MNLVQRQNGRIVFDAPGYAAYKKGLNESIIAACNAPQCERRSAPPVGLTKGGPHPLSHNNLPRSSHHLAQQQNGSKHNAAIIGGNTKNSGRGGRGTTVVGGGGYTNATGSNGGGNNHRWSGPREPGRYVRYYCDCSLMYIYMYIYISSYEKIVI